MSNSAIKKAQGRNLLLLLIAVAVCLGATYHFLADKNVANEKTKSDQNALTEVNITNTGKRPDEQKDWTDRIQNKVNKSEEQMAALANKVDELINLKNENQDNEKFNKLAADIEELKKEKLTQSDHTQKSSEIREDNIPLIDQKLSEDSKETENTTLRNPDNYVPSGTFVKAIMLGGADASAGALGKANPNPVLLRILEQGTLPNNKHSHLKGCLVTAAIVGDVSSERGLMRLERMSCTRTDGEIVDLEVEGTVFGTEGKNGVRGKPLWREGTLLLRAAAAGTFSGFSKGLTQSLTTESISPLGSTQTVNNGDVLKYGAAQGIGNAMDKLAEYNIQRAEQYHPVIQISAGTLVDIVFLKGFSLEENKPASGGVVASKNDETNAANNLSKANTENEEDQNSLTLTEKQAARIKAHEEASGIR